MSKGDKSGPDMENRDSNELNKHIKVQFEDVFGEPESTDARSIDCVWKVSYIVFNGTLGCCYKALSVLCGLPCAFCWACQFGCLACCHIWYLTPTINCMAMCLFPVRRLWMLLLDTYYGPMCETCGLCWSKVTVTNRAG